MPEATRSRNEPQVRTCQWHLPWLGRHGWALRIQSFDSSSRCFHLGKLPLYLHPHEKTVIVEHVRGFRRGQFACILRLDSIGKALLYGGAFRHVSVHDGLAASTFLWDQVDLL